MPVATSPTHYVQELNVGGCGSYWVGLYNTQGGQDGNDFTLDNFRVEDLGATTDMPRVPLPQLTPMRRPLKVPPST